MLKTTLTLACAIIALAITANANAQDCGSCSSAGGYAGVTNYGGYGGYGMADAGANNCGRLISNQGAAGLWAGYCTETCVEPRQRCNLFSGKSRGCGQSRGCGGAGKFGYPGGGCGCNNGCFGYPTGGCGCGGGSGFGGFRHGGRGGCSLFKRSNSCNLGYGGGFGAGGGCGSSCGLGGFSGFGLFSKLKSRSSCGSGCNLFSKFKGRRTQYAAIVTQPVTTVAVDQCGCGNSGQYFNYAVGAEYGTAGMQSGVSQVLSGSSCCGSSVNSALDAGVQSYGNTGAAAIMQ